MKKVEQFKCDFCGTLYNDKAKCFKCESQRVVASEVAVQHHKPMKVAAKYPPRIEVKMSDGTISIYERRGVK